jgi:hypothetical protein
MKKSKSTVRSPLTQQMAWPALISETIMGVVWLYIIVTCLYSRGCCNKNVPVRLPGTSFKTEFAIVNLFPSLTRTVSLCYSRSSDLFTYGLEINIGTLLCCLRGDFAVKDCWDYTPKNSLGIYTLWTLLFTLNFYVPHITTQYHFSAKLCRQDWPEIASPSI